MVATPAGDVQPDDPRLSRGASSPEGRRRGRPRSPRLTFARVRTSPAPRPAPARRRGDDLADAVTATLLAVVLLGGWLLAQMLVLGSLSQERAQEILHGRLRTELAAATAPVGPIVPLGDPVALIAAPAIGLEQVVVEGTASGDLLVGPGHRRDTVLPGQVGTSVVYGRSATYGAPFARLDELASGDVISVHAAQGVLELRVIGVRRAGDPLPQPPQEGAARITLVTAEGQGRLASLRPSSVLYLDAEAEEGFPAPSGRPGGLPESEKAMATEPQTLPLLTLFLSLLLAAVLATASAVRTWSRPTVWLIATPVLLALTWKTTDVVMRLLPNLV